MNRRYISAAAIALIGVALAAVSVVVPDSIGFGGLVFASAAVPVAVLLVVLGRLERKVPVAALVAGGSLAIVISLIGYTVVAGAAYFVIGGFADWFINSADGLLNADLMETIRDPWMIFFAVDLVILAPLVEEFAKAISSRLSRPFDRKSAFLTGVSAGVGFAVIENIAYATGGFFDVHGWEVVALVRMLGSAVHPVAAGLVALGWWEFRNGTGRGKAVRLVGAGVGVHALWNGAVLAVFVVSASFAGDTTALESVLVTVAYAGALGLIIAAGGWQALNRVADDELPSATADPGDARAMSAWVVIASTMLIPAIAVVFALNSGS
jgi:RsiW-degrading membrane proteinase PrsW (M82 family)